MTYDVCIIGAGLVGLGVARALSESHDGVGIVILDKEPAVAMHQSSHNSGVAHSGLYYRPGSLKARLCVEGRRSLEEYCETRGIAFSRSGKLVIATGPAQLGPLAELERRGIANGLSGLERLNAAGLRELEPAAVGLEALHVPEAGVVDFPAVAVRLAAELSERGADLRFGHVVTSIDHDGAGARIRVADQEIRARLVVNCAGLHSDRVALMAGVRSNVRIVPFRGEYYTLVPEAEHLVRALIYPVPDPRFPFLGVHFTRRIDGAVEVGPNAVLALGREHYRDVGPDWGEVRETLAFPGFRKLARRHWRTGASEMIRSRSRSMYARSARSLVPDIRPQHLIPGGAGVRAQAVSPDGSLVDDFVIEEAGPTVHVLNAPSPGATASFAIGGHVAEIAARHLGR
ncbi:MAG TPA: L-2-hydroxyglutarate oxidase [Acidimicrobiia bacterium]|nr:L-2-hydroxyglutarate oxidase [Acidimicrobiia bacterium]